MLTIRTNTVDNPFFRCGNTSYVQKDDFEEAKVLFCPLPGCRYMWCKACQVPIPLVKNPEEPEHSCDGSSELTHLMKQRGWKHCPGCKTPTEKIDGCNHMTVSYPRLYALVRSRIG